VSTPDPVPSDFPDRQGREAFANALPDYWIDGAILEGVAAAAGVSVEKIKAELPAIRVAMRNAKVAKDTRQVLAAWTPSKVQHRLQGGRILLHSERWCRVDSVSPLRRPENTLIGHPQACCGLALLMQCHIMGPSRRGLV